MISNIEYYRTFLYTAQMRSFTSAAEYLCVSQSAVSQSIRKLENELGCKLFSRNAREFSLTPEGELLLSYVQRAMKEFYTGENMVTKISSMQLGELRIGATETPLRFFLPGIIRSFHDKYPNVKITFQGSTVHELGSMLQDGDIELAFLVMPAPIADIFQVTKVLEFQDIPVVSSDFDIDVNKTYTLDDLSDYPLITVPQDTQVRRLFDGWFLKSGKLLSPDYTVRSMSIVQTLTESGVGIGLLPEPLVHDKLVNGELVQLKTSTLPPKRSICIAINPVHDLSLTAQSFISLFNETISQK